MPAGAALKHGKSNALDRSVVLSTTTRQHAVRAAGGASDCQDPTASNPDRGRGGKYHYHSDYAAIASYRTRADDSE